METINDIFEQFALVFVGQFRGDGEIAFTGKLDRSRLDFSLESLQTVDSYLAYLHGRRQFPSENELQVTVLWGGAYLGEVIRRNAKRQYNWVDYDEYMPEHPRLQSILGERTVATCALLCTATAMTMPLNKIARFIEEGPENSTHYYASVECQQI